MKPDRLEELLRTGPPDEPRFQGRLDLETDGDRHRSGGVRRSVLAASVAGTAVVALAVGLLLGQVVGTRPGTPSPSPAASATPAPTWSVGVIPWIDASPSPAAAPTVTPTLDAASLPACAASDLVLVGGGWQGATGGQLVGGVSMLNISQDACQVSGVPQVDLLDAHGTVVAPGTIGPAESPPAPVPLPSAGVAIVGVSWRSWCGPRPDLPLQMRVTLPGGGGVLTGPVLAIHGPHPKAMATEFPSCLPPGGSGSFFNPYGISVPARRSSATAPDACTAGQLVAFTGSVGPAAGTEWTTLFVLNLLGVDCALPASPTLELRDANGKVLITAKPAAASGVTIVLPAASAASAMVGMADWCLSAPKEPLSLDLFIGSTRVPVTSSQPIAFSGCSSPGTPPPSFLYGAALALPSTPSPAPTVNPVDALPISASFSALPSVIAGETLRYTVTITSHDPEGKSIDLAQVCPNYTESLVLAGNPAIEEQHALNCAAAGVLEPGGSITFGMELQVPADASPGPAMLMWHLGDFGAGAKEQVNVLAP